MQKSIFNFFKKAPAPASKEPLQTKASNNGQTSSSGINSKYPPGSLVWSKLPGYPWWPSMVCNHPTDGKCLRKGEIHVQFLDTPVTRSWVPLDMIKRWDAQVLKDGAGDKNWEKGVKDAEKVAKLSNEERLDTLLVDLLPSDEEWSEEEVSPGSKENKAGRRLEPEKKRRRIMVMDSDIDDSDNDESFQPSKDDLKQEDDDESSGDESEDHTGDEEPESSPIKGRKRKILAKDSVSKKQCSAKQSATNTPVNKLKNFSLGASKSSPSSSSALPGVCDSTKKKLSMFGATGGETGSVQYSHMNHQFLKPDQIRDKDKRPRSDPEYNPRTLFVPPSFLSSQTPAQRQWW